MKILSPIFEKNRSKQTLGGPRFTSVSTDGWIPLPNAAAGRLARAMVTLQLCALSSKAGRHAEALEEAAGLTPVVFQRWIFVDGQAAKVQGRLKDFCWGVELKE